MPATALQRAGLGTQDYIAIGRQYTPGGSGAKGTAVARTAFLPWKTNALNPKKPPFMDRVSRGSTSSDGIFIPGIETNDGDISWLMNTTLGKDLIWACLGGEASISAISATATGPAVTGLGITTIPVTLVGAVAGEPVLVNAGTATEEPTVIQSYTAGSLVVPALSMFNGANQSGATMPITMPASMKYDLSLIASGFGDDYPLLTIEKAIGKVWGRLFIDVLIERLALNYNKTIHEMVASPYGTGESSDLLVGGLTAYAPTTADEKKALAPLTAQVGAISLLGDPLGTGTSTQQGAVSVQDAKITYDNRPVKDNVFGNPAMQAFGRDATVSVDYTKLETERRSAQYEDLVKLGTLGAMAFAFARNYGTVAVPVNKLMTVYMASLGHTESLLSSAPGALRTWTNKAQFVPTPGGSTSPMTIYIST